MQFVSLEPSSGDRDLKFSGGMPGAMCAVRSRCKPRAQEATGAQPALRWDATSTRELTSVLRRTTRALTRALGADIGCLWCLADNGAELGPIAAYHRAARQLDGDGRSLPVLHSHRLVEPATLLDGPIYSNGNRTDLRIDCPLLREFPHASAPVHLLRVKRKVNGAMVVVSVRRAHRFTATELRLVEAISLQAAVAVANARRMAYLGHLNAALERRLCERASELEVAHEALRESREELSLLSRELQAAREMERTRIAREIHDELAQGLTGLKLDLAGLMNERTDGLETRAERVRAMSTGIDAIIGVVRRIASELRPAILDDFGLVAAMEWQARDFQTRTGIRCRFTCHGALAHLDRERSTAVFRIVQETLTNVVRHAEATEVDVRLKTRPSSLVLEVRDNGKGVQQTPSSDPRQLGLIGMRERAAEFGGAVAVLSRAGNGTTVRLSMPLPGRYRARKRQEPLRRPCSVS